MATKGLVIVAHHDGVVATLCVRVEGDATGPEGEPSAVEYWASCPVADGRGVPRPPGEVEADLVARIKAQRSPPVLTPLNLSGEIDL